MQVMLQCNAACMQVWLRVQQTSIPVSAYPHILIMQHSSPHHAIDKAGGAMDQATVDVIEQAITDAASSGLIGKNRLFHENGKPCCMIGHALHAVGVTAEEVVAQQSHPTDLPDIAYESLGLNRYLIDEEDGALDFRLKDAASENDAGRLGDAHDTLMRALRNAAAPLDT